MTERDLYGYKNAVIELYRRSEDYETALHAMHDPATAAITEEERGSNASPDRISPKIARVDAELDRLAFARNKVAEERDKLLDVMFYVGNRSAEYIAVRCGYTVPIVRCGETVGVKFLDFRETAEKIGVSTSGLSKIRKNLLKNLENLPINS